MGVYVTVSSTNQVGIINENAAPETRIWFDGGAQVKALISALQEAERFVEQATRKPRWEVK